MVLFDLQGDAAEPGSAGRHFADNGPSVGVEVVALDRVVIAIPTLLATANVNRTVDYGHAYHRKKKKSLSHRQNNDMGTKEY